jgi:membrane-associated protease RseP (regulator of RpoE activity)
MSPGFGRYAAHPTRLWLHALLLLLTLLTTTIVGARLAANFEQNLPAFQFDEDLNFLFTLWQQPSHLAAGLPFSLTLLSILLAHEFGHYFACLYHRIDSSLPYFLPAPTLIGTFGAFIRIRAPIFSRRDLFDVGIAGPIAGFVFLIPALGIGLALSKVIPGIANQGDLTFGNPPLLWLSLQAVFPGVEPADVYLHPVARAAWIGLFATALNLLPIGQLDGGHILYAFTGPLHRRLSQIFAVALIPLGYFYWTGWILWAIFFLLTGLRRPAIIDESPVGAGRLRLGLLAAAIFLLSFTPDPIQTAMAL